MNNYTIINTIRHAQTDYNVEKRYAGTIDVSLNDTGIRDTINASRKLDHKKFDLVITSPLKRTIQTAQLLLDGQNNQIIQNPLCIERNFGKMQGLTVDEIKFIKPKIEYVKVGGIDHSLNPPEGEILGSLRKRAQEFYHFIFREYHGLDILVVSHEVFLQQFHGLILDKNCKESLAIKVPKLELSRYCFKGNQLLKETKFELNTDRCEFFW